MFIKLNSLTNNLVAHYPFDSNANDESGNGNHGIIYGATLDTDRFGNLNSCFNFNGINSYIKVSNGSPFDFTNDYSISVWVNPSTKQNFIATLLEKSHDSPSPCEWAMEQVEGSTNFYRSIYRDSLTNTWVSLNQGVSITPNTWNHYVVIKHGNILTSYLNNKLVLTVNGASSSIISNGNLPLFIGAYGGWDRFFSGLMDDIYIYNRAITEDERSILFNGLVPSVVPTKAPTSLYRCLSLTYLHLSSIGDLDRKNEEIELHITSNRLPSTDRSEFSCGLFLFDLTSNDDKELDIVVPCMQGENVLVRMYERDNCNDDTVAQAISCDDTGEQTKVLDFDITADDTTTEYTKCISFSNAVEGCIEGGSATIGGSFCSQYTWGEEECGTIGVKETTSKYILEYRVEDRPCDLEYKNKVDKICPYDSYIPGPTCTLPLVSKSNDASNIVLSWEVSLIAGSSMLYMLLE